MDRININIKLGGEKLRLAIPIEQEPIYRSIGYELDRLYYVYKEIYPEKDGQQLYAIIAYAYALQKAGVITYDTMHNVSSRKLHWRAFIAPLKKMFFQSIRHLYYRIENLNTHQY